MSIIIKNLNKTYSNGHQALKDVNLEIKPGMFGLLGPNGAGKSTLMRILVALMEPTDGEVEIYGCNLLKERKEVRRILGYLPQDFRFFSKFTVWEFLEYSACLSGMDSKRERKKAMISMLEQVGLYEVRDRLAGKLSGGMKRRLGIAQALIHSPKVIIVDEPTTGLDPEERIRFRNLLSEISAGDTTILLSTHIVGDISSSCKDMALLNKGEISFKGSPTQMLSDAEGKVWKLKVNYEQYQDINSKHPVVAMIPQDDDKWYIEVVSDRVPGYEDLSVNIHPHLEHAYVYYMEKELNLWLND